jgi:hypothetical protein
LSSNVSARLPTSPLARIALISLFSVIGFFRNLPSAAPIFLGLTTNCRSAAAPCWYYCRSYSAVIGKSVAAERVELLIFLSRQISKVRLQLFALPCHLPPVPCQLDVILPDLPVASGRSVPFAFGGFHASVSSNY